MVLHGRFNIRQRNLAWMIGALLERFLGVPPRRNGPHEESAPEPAPAASGHP